MAVIKDGKATYVGRVLCEREKYWLDGMLEVWAVVWDSEARTTKDITVGYYGIDGCNLAGCGWEIDATDDVKREVLRALKDKALKAFCRSVADARAKIMKGNEVEVIRGRKIAKGTKLKVFWVGERETYLSKQYAWMNEYEEIAGCFDQDGNKIYIKTEYLKNLTELKYPCAAERKKFIKAWVKDEARAYGIYLR